MAVGMRVSVTVRVASGGGRRAAHRPEKARVRPRSGERNGTEDAGKVGSRMAYVLGHIGHWTTSLIYLLPFIGIGLWLALDRWRHRNRSSEKETDGVSDPR